MPHTTQHASGAKQRRQGNPTGSPSLRRRLRYRFDNTLAHGPLALIGWLGLTALTVLVVASVAGGLLLGQDFFFASWRNLLRILGKSETEERWPARILALGVILFGLFVGSAFIGLIATALNERIRRVRQGRGPVLETNHSLILGWSPRLPLIIKELVIANENVPRSAVVVLTPRSVTDMEVELRSQVGDTRNTRVICRTGDPAKGGDLTIANSGAARSIIALSGDEGDAAVVNAILAVKALHGDLSAVNLVAEFADPDHADTIRALTDGAVKTVNSDDIISHVTAQACRQPGLSAVLLELLEFEGDECYFAPVPELVGHTYGEALLAFPTSSVIGCRTPDGRVELNPSPQRIFEVGDEVVAVSQDDDTVAFGGFEHVPVPRAALPDGEAPTPVRVLIVGWSSLGGKVLQVLRAFLDPGSTIEVCVDPGLVSAESINGTHPELPVFLMGGGAEKLRALTERGPYDQVIVLGYRDGLTPSEADSRTLLILLTLRKIWPAHATPRTRIIAEILDQTNVDLATVTGVDDFIVSDALASLMLAQLSERPQLQAVFDELFDPNGLVLELRNANRYVPDAVVTHAEVVAGGAARHVSVLGWRVGSTQEVVLNPPKHEKVHLGADDQLIVIGRRGS